MPQPHLSQLDIWILALYAVMMIVLGVAASRNTKGANDYFLAGRNMNWFMIGFALFASNISSTTMVGLAGDAYSTGISVYNYEWMAGVVLVFFSVFILPMVLRSQVYTMPEYLERRFDRRARSMFAMLTLFLNIVVDTAASLYAGMLRNSAGGSIGTKAIDQSGKARPLTSAPRICCTSLWRLSILMREYRSTTRPSSPSSDWMKACRL
jgi:Na+/proline symporter